MQCMFIFITQQKLFLRQLEAPSVSKLDYGATCVTTLDKNLKITLTLSQALKENEKIEASFAPNVEKPSEDNTFAYSFTETRENKTTTVELSTLDTKTAVAGTYKLIKGKYTDDAQQQSNLELPTDTLKYTPEFKLDTTQTTTQEIDVSQTDKKTFAIKFNPAFTEVPKIFTAKDSDKEITCTADKDNKVLTCTPSTTNMEEGKEYKVAFQQACEGAKVETGVTVKATKLTNSTTDASYMRISQLLLFIGLFLL